MKLYALVGNKSKDYISYGGRVLVHHDPEELKFLFPNMRVVETKDLGKEMMLVRDHPDLSAISWPLQKEDFK